MSRNGRIALIAGAVVVAIVAFIVIQSGSSGSGGGGSESASKSSVQHIDVSHGKPVGGVHKISIKKNDTLRLTVSSPNTTEEIHVHGYDLKQDMAPGRPASFRFKTKIEGAFEIELEQTGTKIANLLVQPG